MLLIVLHEQAKFSKNSSQITERGRDRPVGYKSNVCNINFTIKTPHPNLHIIVFNN